MFSWIRRLFWKPDYINIHLIEFQARVSAERLMRQIEERYAYELETNPIYKVQWVEDCGTYAQFHILGEFETREEAEEFRRTQKIYEGSRYVAIVKMPKNFI